MLHVNDTDSKCSTKHYFQRDNLPGNGFVHYYTVISFFPSERCFCSELGPLAHRVISEGLHIEIKWFGARKEGVAMGAKFFIVIGVFPVELLACQVSMAWAANWPR